MCKFKIFHFTNYVINSFKSNLKFSSELCLFVLNFFYFGVGGTGWNPVGWCRYSTNVSLLTQTHIKWKSRVSNSNRLNVIATALYFSLLIIVHKDGGYQKYIVNMQKIWISKILFYHVPVPYSQGINTQCKK